MNEEYERRKELHAGGLPPGDPRHGTVNGYANRLCRCAACRKAWARYHRERGYQTGYLAKKLPQPDCEVEGCDRPVDRAYPTGLCHRHNVAAGVKPEVRKGTS